MFENSAPADPVAYEATLVTRIAELERGKSAAAAEQARLTAELDGARRAREAAQGVSAAKRGKGLGAEIALARHDSPNRGGRHLGFARALVHEMPHTLGALECGALSEWRATLIVRESACLSVEHRRVLDTRMCADHTTLEGKGDKRIEADAKAIAYELDPQAVVDRAVRAESERTVTCRPAPDNLAYVTALLPMRQGVAVYAALRRAGDTTFDGRGRGQVMADTLVERVTGRPADAPVPVAVNLVMSDQSLLGGDNSPAHVDGCGPIPAEVARRLVDAAATDKRSAATLRRLYRHPKSGALLAMESRSRRFPKGLARFIGFRDQSCRTPYCDAPIRHRDHAVPRNRGGPTNTLNGLGMCERCNYDKESPGWHVSPSEQDGVHTAEFTTPTGAHHRSTAPPLPGPPMVEVSEVEARVSIALTDLHAA
jgi:hypothetical protein